MSKLTLPDKLEKLKILIKYSILILFIITTLLYNIRFSYFAYQYHFNNKIFTQNYCINKDKPKLKCNGKCELAKLAIAAEKQDQKDKSISGLDIIFFIPTPTSFEIKKNSLNTQLIQTCCNKHNYDFLIYFDPPPKINFQILT